MTIPSETIIPITLWDGGENPREVTGRLTIYHNGIGIAIDGYGTKTGIGSSEIIWVEFWDREPRVHAWPDITSEDPESIALGMASLELDPDHGEDHDSV